VFTAIYGTLGAVLLVNLLHLAFARRRFGSQRPGSPRVSVIVPARNEAHNLESLLSSLLRQSWADLEVIIYDDDSTDETWRILSSTHDARVRPIRGSSLPHGWVGKVHALYQATRTATGDLYLFLDADAMLRDERALERLVTRFHALDHDSVLTGITRARGGGQLLVSLIPFVILTWLPLPLAERLRSRLLSSLNGQCWMIDRLVYHRLEPHLYHRDEVLEDVHIGRFLKANGVIPHLQDLQGEVDVRMYADLRAAWRGFRKNVYPFMGEKAWSFATLHVLYVATFLVAPLVSPWFLVGCYGLKTVSDRFAHMPLIVSLATPVALVMGAVLQIDSAVAHWRGRAVWKERCVAKRHLNLRTPRGMLDDDVRVSQD
jgi:glycosyltransferase involved in cell wall biosynthesis